MPLFEYEYRHTPFHTKLNPYSKAVLTVLPLLATLGMFDPIVLLPLTVLSLVFAVIARMPRDWHKLLITVTVVATGSRLILALFMGYAGYYEVLPPELTEKPILVNPIPEWVPWFGMMKLTWGGLIYTLGFNMRCFIAFYMVALFIYTTSPDEIVQALLKVKVPYKAIFVTLAAFRFFPVMTRALESIMNAQTLRGWVAKSKNPIKLAKQFLPLTIPLIGEVDKVVDEVTMSITSRAFGAGGGWTLMKEHEFSYLDYTVIILTIVASVYLFLAFFLWNLGKI